MVSIILSSRPLVYSSFSHGLLLIPSSVFFISVIVFLSFDWFFFILFSSLLIFPLCSPIPFPSSVSILITNTLNYSSGKLFISVDLCFISCFFQVFFLPVLSFETTFTFFFILLNFFCLYELR